MARKTLKYYHQLPYTRRTELVKRTDGEGYFYVAEIAELEGCYAVGETEEKAMVKLEQAFDDFIEALLEWGKNIPEPHRECPARKIPSL